MDDNRERQENLIERSKIIKHRSINRQKNVVVRHSDDAKAEIKLYNDCSKFFIENWGGATKTLYMIRSMRPSKK